MCIRDSIRGDFPLDVFFFLVSLFTETSRGKFVVVFVHAVFVLREQHCPVSLPWAQMFVMANMLVLFGQFYVKSYATKKAGADGGKKKR